MSSTAEQPKRSIVEYDSIRRRLWILGQRCHHGAAGSLVSAFACVGLVAGKPTGPRKPLNIAALALATTGGALMAHDWKDHAIWFERGWGTQP